MVPSPPEVIQWQRLVEEEVLGRPHLVLADLGGDVDVMLQGQLVEPLDGVLRLDLVLALAEAQALLGLPLGDLAPTRLSVRPLLMALPRRRQAPSSASSVRSASPITGTSTATFLLIDDGSISTWILWLAGREAVEPAGDPVVEAGTDIDHDVAVVHRHVGFVGAVHAEHADELLVGGRIGTEAHQREGDRVAGLAHQLGQQLRRPWGRH